MELLDQLEYTFKISIDPIKLPLKTYQFTVPPAMAMPVPSQP